MVTVLKMTGDRFNSNRYGPVHIDYRYNGYRFVSVTVEAVTGLYRLSLKQLSIQPGTDEPVIVTVASLI
jgi:hypothetical protein